MWKQSYWIQFSTLNRRSEQETGLATKTRFPCLQKGSRISIKIILWPGRNAGVAGRHMIANFAVWTIRVFKTKRSKLLGLQRSNWNKWLNLGWIFTWTSLCWHLLHLKILPTKEAKSSGNKVVFLEPSFSRATHLVVECKPDLRRTKRMTSWVSSLVMNRSVRIFSRPNDGDQVVFGQDATEERTLLAFRTLPVVPTQLFLTWKLLVGANYYH